MSNHKILNQINNIVGKVLEENELLKGKINSLTSESSIETEGGNASTVEIMELAGEVLGKDISKVYLGWQEKMEYDEDGPTLTYDEYFQVKFDKWFTENKVFKRLPYGAVYAFTKDKLRDDYNREVNDLKMEYVRKHKKD